MKLIAHSTGSSHTNTPQLEGLHFIKPHLEPIPYKDHLSRYRDFQYKDQGPVSIYRPSFPGIGILMLKIRRSRDRLIFNMGIPILVRQSSLYWDGPQTVIRPAYIYDEITIQVRWDLHVWLIVAWKFHMATQIWVNIGSGNGVLHDGTKPLLEPMLTYHQ